MPRLSLLTLTVLLTAILGCGSDDDQAATSMGNEFTKEGTLAFIQPSGDTLRTIDIEIADTPEQRTRGLMFRRSMPYSRGMLFLFPEADTSGFWMKNTAMPLDIIFVAPDSQVVSIAKRTTPFSEEQIWPGGRKQFVVEVRAGFVDRFGISDSTRIRWERSE